MAASAVLALAIIFLQLVLPLCAGPQSSRAPKKAFMVLPPLRARSWQETSEMRSMIGLPCKYINWIRTLKSVFVSDFFFEAIFYENSKRVKKQSFDYIDFTDSYSDEVLLPAQVLTGFSQTIGSSALLSSSLQLQTQFLVQIRVWILYTVFPNPSFYSLQGPQPLGPQSAFLSNQVLPIKLYALSLAEEHGFSSVGLPRWACRYIGVNIQEYDVATPSNSYLQIIVNIIVTPCLIEFVNSRFKTQVIIADQILMMREQAIFIGVSEAVPLVFGIGLSFRKKKSAR